MPTLQSSYSTVTCTRHACTPTSYDVQSSYKQTNHTYHNQRSHQNSSNTTNLTANCAPSALTVHVHGVNGLLAIVDIFISRVPFQFLHLFYPSILTALYALLNGLYFAASGEIVYNALNYRDSLGTAIGLVIVLALSATPIYIVLFLLAWFRDVVYKRVACCFRDIRHVGDYNKPHTVNGKPHTVNGTDEKNPDEMVEIAFEA